MAIGRTTGGPGAAAGPPEALVRTLRRVLRPLVGLLLHYGIPFQLLAELLKSVYVEAAQASPGEGKLTQSRISLMTGVHRKDVRRLMGRQSDAAEIPADVSLGVQIAARWLSDRDLTDAEGEPLALPRLASQGGERSFEGLVARVSKDIRSRAVLDEWLRLGVVSVDAEDRVQLRADAFVPEKGFEEKVFFLGQNLHDHIATAAANVIGRGPARLERSVFYEGLAVESVAELAHLAERHGMHALVELNRRAAELQQRDQAAHTGGRRMNFGLYFYEEPDAPEGGGDGT